MAYTGPYPIPVSSGGTGLTGASLTAHSIVLGEGTSPMAVVGTVGGSTQVLQGNTGADPSWSTLSGSGGTTVTFGAGTITIGTTGGLIWNDTTASGNLVANNGYYVTSGAVSLALPAVIAKGTVIAVVLDAGTSWTITQGAGQQIRFGNVQTSAGVGGSLASSTTGDAVTLLCTVANTNFVVLNSVGNITYV